MNTINIGLFGFGTVGQGIYKVIGRAANAHAEIKRICVRNLSKPRTVEVPAGLLTDNENDILDDPSINLILPHAYWSNSLKSSFIPPVPSPLSYP